MNLPWEAPEAEGIAAFVHTMSLAAKPCPNPDKGRTLGRCSNPCDVCSAKHIMREARILFARKKDTEPAK